MPVNFSYARARESAPAVMCFHNSAHIMGSKDITSVMLVAIFVSDVTTSTAHLYEIILIYWNNKLPFTTISHTDHWTWLYF